MPEPAASAFPLRPSPEIESFLSVGPPSDARMLDFIRATTTLQLRVEADEGYRQREMGAPDTVAKLISHCGSWLAWQRGRNNIVLCCTLCAYFLSLNKAHAALVVDTTSEEEEFVEEEAAAAGAAGAHNPPLLPALLAAGLLATGSFDDGMLAAARTCSIIYNTYVDCAEGGGAPSDSVTPELTAALHALAPAALEFSCRVLCLYGDRVNSADRPSVPREARAALGALSGWAAAHTGSSAVWTATLIRAGSRYGFSAPPIALLLEAVRNSVVVPAQCKALWALPAGAGDAGYAALHGLPPAAPSPPLHPRDLRCGSCFHGVLELVETWGDDARVIEHGLTALYNQACDDEVMRALAGAHGALIVRVGRAALAAVARFSARPANSGAPLPHHHKAALLSALMVLWQPCSGLPGVEALGGRAVLGVGGLGLIVAALAACLTSGGRVAPGDTTLHARGLKLLVSLARHPDAAAGVGGAGVERGLRSLVVAYAAPDAPEMLRVEAGALLSALGRSAESAPIVSRLLLAMEGGEQ